LERFSKVAPAEAALLLTVSFGPGLIDRWRDDVTMGNPRISSLDLPNRCLDLLDELWDVVANDQPLGARHGGSADRAHSETASAAEGRVDDWHVDRDLADRIRLDFTLARSSRCARSSPKEDGWSYVGYDSHHNFA
jgi:hypothetical protein